MRTLSDTLGEIFRALWAHKLRSFLTMFGIAWGVGSLLLLVGVGEGFRSGNRREMSTLGEDVMFVFPGHAPAIQGSAVGMRTYYLTQQDYLDIAAEAPAVKEVSPVLQRGDIQVVSDYTSTNGQVQGVTPNYNKIRYVPIGSGRWLNPDDEEQKLPVLVMGDEARRILFPHEEAVGSYVLLNGVRFRVIGVLQRIGHGENNEFNLRMFLPYSTMRSLFPAENVGETLNAISYINYQPRTRAQHDEAKLEVHRILARNHNFDWQDQDAFDEWDSVQSFDMVLKIFNVMDWFLGSVGLITLGLGAIGVINIMLVTVSERTREIGIRKALGATRHNILLQFTLEGMLLTLVSGSIGIGGAALLTHLLRRLPAPQGFDPPRIVAWSAVIAVGGLALAGTAAGLYPARKAALLEPVEALRQE
jgi:putative ABC transport system permease protein